MPYSGKATDILTTSERATNAAIRDEYRGHRERGRAANAAFVSSVRRHHRWQDLSPASKAKMDAKFYARMDAERHAEVRAELDRISNLTDAEAEAELAKMESSRVATIHHLPISSTLSLPLTFFDDCRERARKNWIFKGVFAKGENSSTFGAPGTLKSALLEDAAVHAAAGKDWRGFKSKEKCGVVYFAFERADQVRRRLAAYAVRDGLKDLPVAVAGNIVDMLNPGCVDIVVATIRAAETRFGIPVGLIIFDTWSKGIAAGGGDEDKARDQNIIAANLRRIHERVAVHIAGVGHSGKDETRGERGSNARQGDVDLQIQITGDAIKTATVIKANDRPEGPLTSYAGEVVALGTDEDGDAVTAFILSPRIYAAGPKGNAKLSDRQVLALDALRRAIQEHGQRIDGVQAVDVEHWREELFCSGVIDRSAGNPRSSFKKLKDALARSKRIVEHDGFVRLSHAAPITPLTSLGNLPG